LTASSANFGGDTFAHIIVFMAKVRFSIFQYHRHLMVEELAQIYGLEDCWWCCERRVRQFIQEYSNHAQAVNALLECSALSHCCVPEPIS